ncbi:MAP kinase-activated protein kinase 2-like isoform X2 [Symsagittifera roscoffensis]|uniref:MAP kinase-activated protein kinase 2-like isoform X2 n=1 Tax=Symsagittifera roscoffensis TaxID=84072 RepID=UPI00307BCA52
MTMGQESSSSKHNDDQVLAKYYSQLKPRKEPFAEKYELINTVLGEGITGKVYKCRLKRTPNSEVFALKALPKVGKTVREVVLHKRMQSGCKYIVQIKDVFENVVREREVLFIVMELMEGGELFTAISSRYPHKPFSEREVAQLVLCVCTAVKHLHDNGIAHRDLKPENLLFSSSNPDEAIIKLTDFGFAKESVDSLKTPNFTPYYGAPELMMAVKDPHQKSCYSSKCDTWSLGVIIYIMLSGYPPFYNSQGQSALTPQMMHRITEANYKFPKEHGWTFVSDKAKQLIRKLLVNNPDNRLCINQTLKDPWLTNFHLVPDSPLNSAGHGKLSWLNWTAVLNTIAHPPIDVFRTQQRIILKPPNSNDLYVRRLKKAHKEVENQSIKEEHDEVDSLS